MEINSSLNLDISQYTAKMQQAGNVATQSLNKVNTQIAQLNSGLLSVAKTFAGVFLSISALKNGINLAENFDNVSGTIKNATSSLDEFRFSQAKTFESAQKLGLTYDEMASSVTALLPPLKAIGASTKTVQTFAETLQAGFKANAFKGGAGVITALAKSFNKGTIDAKAFQATLLAIPDLAEKLGSALGKTEAEIKALGVAGKLNTADFVKGVNSLNSEYLSQANNVNTLANSFNYLRNAIAQYLSGVNGASGFTQKLGSVIRVVADNIDILAKGLTAIVAIKIAQFFGGMIASVASATAGIMASVGAFTAETVAITKNTKALTANAIIRKAQQAGVATNSVNMAGNAIANMAGGFAGVGNVIAKLGSVLKGAGIAGVIVGLIAVTGEWQNALDSVKYIFSDLAGVAKTAFNAISETISGAWQGLKGFVADSGILGNFFAEMDGGIFGLFETIGKLADGVVAGIKTAFGVLIQNSVNSVKFLYNTITAPLRGLFSAVENGFNKIIKQYNSIAEKIKLTTIDYNLDLSEIKDKLKLDIDFAGLKDAKSLFNANYSEQRENGLQAYFEQMKRDIDAQRAVNDAELQAKNAQISSLNNINDNFIDINNILTDEKNKLKKSTETATDIQIQIEKTFQADTIDYKLIDELVNKLNQVGGNVDWNEVARQMGIGISSQIGIGELGKDDPYNGVNLDNLAKSIDAQTQVLKTMQENQSQAQTVENKGSVTLNIITERERLSGEITGTATFIDAFSRLFDNKVQELATVNY